MRTERFVRCAPDWPAWLARDREILTLTAWEGLTPKQIAAVAGLPTGTIRVRLHRARSRLKRRIAGVETPTLEAERAISTPTSGTGPLKQQ